MGMYTEIVLGVNLRADTPAQVISLLEYMLGGKDCPADILTHPLFECARWEHMLRSGSYYFAGPTNSLMVREGDGGEWHLAVRANLKNYDGEIEKFCDWLRPYISDPSPGEFMGYSRYESAPQPTLLYV